MDFERAINIAIACVMASHMENKDKRETIEKLRELEDKLEEFRDDGWLDEQGEINSHSKEIPPAKAGSVIYAKE